jgi:raffinose/stachyose/melibiose transport system permease protein
VSEQPTSRVSGSGGAGNAGRLLSGAAAAERVRTFKPSKTVRPLRRGRLQIDNRYPRWFYVPAGVIYIGLFAVPTFASFYFALTRWTFFTAKFDGLENFREFFQTQQLTEAFTHTLIYAFLTSGAKVVLGMLIALFLASQIWGRNLIRSVVFFPVLVSAVGVGLTFNALLNPQHGVVNHALAAVGIGGPGWFTDPSLALYSVAFVDIWRGVGLATVIYMAGIAAIPQDCIEAARIDGAGRLAAFRYVMLPLLWPATATVIILSLIGGLRAFDIIWTTTGGGPGFSSDVVASVIYKEYQAGFYGLSTAGNVILFVVVSVIVIPLTIFLTRKQVDL